MKLGAQLRGQTSDELGIGAGLGPQTMVQVRGMHGESPGRCELHERMQEADAVRAAADANDHVGCTGEATLRLREESMASLRGQNGFDDRQREGGIGLYQAGILAHRRDYTIPAGRNAFFGPLFIMV